MTIHDFTMRHRPRLLLPILAAIALAGGAVMLPLAAADKEIALPALAPITSFAPVVKQVAPSVVTISTSKSVKRMRAPEGMRLPEGMRVPEEMKRFFDQDNRGQQRQSQGIGSGVIVSADGYILTNNHVIEGADTITVTMASGRDRFTATLVGADAKSDLAVLKIEVKETVPAIKIGDSDVVEVGDVVLAIGNPFGVGQTVTSGIVSARGRGVGLTDYEDFIQTDASINPGNSGGALVDAHGRLIGINTAILSPSGGNLGIGFAIPINLAKGIKDSLIANGKVVRGYMGVLLQPLTPELAQAFNLKAEQGVLIGDVPKDGPAAQAGVKPGDILMTFNGRPVDDLGQLRIRAAQAVPGTTVTVGIMRDGKQQDLMITIGVMPGEPVANKVDEKVKESEKAKLGVRLGELDQESRERYEIPEHISGVVIHEVVPGSRADHAGLRPGTVIMEVARKPVSKAKEAVQAIAKAEGDILLRIFAGQGANYLVVKQLADK